MTELFIAQCIEVVEGDQSKYILGVFTTRQRADKAFVERGARNDFPHMCLNGEHSVTYVVLDIIDSHGWY